MGLVQQGPFPGACAGWTFGMSVSATGQLSAGAWAAFNMNSGATTVPLEHLDACSCDMGQHRGQALHQWGAGRERCKYRHARQRVWRICAGQLWWRCQYSTQIDELRVSNVQRTSFSIASPPTFALSVANRNWRGYGREFACRDQLRGELFGEL